MSFDLARLDEEKHQMINQLEQQLGCILIAYEGYQKEDEQGQPQQS